MGEGRRNCSAYKAACMLGGMGAFFTSYISAARFVEELLVELRNRKEVLTTRAQLIPEGQEGIEASLTLSESFPIQRAPAQYVQTTFSQTTTLQFFAS